MNEEEHNYMEFVNTVEKKHMINIYNPYTSGELVIPMQTKKCPMCGGLMILKRTLKGKLYFCTRIIKSYADLRIEFVKETKKEKYTIEEIRKWAKDKRYLLDDFDNILSQCAYCENYKPNGNDAKSIRFNKKFK